MNATEDPWLVQIYQMSSQPAQVEAADLLTSAGGFSVDLRNCEQGAFLVVECADPSQALAVYELVIMTDHDAELIHSTTGPRPEPVAVTS